MRATPRYVSERKRRLSWEPRVLLGEGRPRPGDHLSPSSPWAMGSRLAAVIGFLSAGAFLLEARKPGVSTGPGVPTVWVVKGESPATQPSLGR